MPEARDHRTVHTIGTWEDRKLCKSKKNLFQISNYWSQVRCHKSWKFLDRCVHHQWTKSMYSDRSLDFQASCLNFIDLFEHVIQNFASQEEHISFFTIMSWTHSRITDVWMCLSVDQSPPIWVAVKTLLQVSFTFFATTWIPTTSRQGKVIHFSNPLTSNMMRWINPIGADPLSMKKKL